LQEQNRQRRAGSSERERIPEQLSKDKKTHRIEIDIVTIKKQLQEFLTWWLTGLLYLLPETLRLKVKYIPDRLTIALNNRDYVLTYFHGSANELIEQRIFPRDDELEKASALQWLSPIIDSDTEIVVLMAEQQVLRKSLTLPITAEKDLAEILRFEMDRQTPFTIDDVYFDYSIVKRDPEQQKIQLELFVTPKQQIDQILEEIHSWRLRPKAVIIGDNDNAIEGINLLPFDARSSTNNRANPLTCALAACAVVLFIAALYAPLTQQQKVLHDLEQDVNNSRVRAKQALTLGKEKESILARRKFLTEMRTIQIPAIEILEELTNVLPDNTWLNRLRIADGEIQIHGESDTATSIIQIIENSDYFQNAQFRSPVTQNNATKKDKFHVAAMLTGKQPL